jgi:hypothetical protein
MSLLFKEFVTESRGFSLTPKEYAKVTEITKKYINLVNNIDLRDTIPLPRRFFKDIKITKDSKIKPRFIKLVDVELLDRETQNKKYIEVIVVFDYPSPPYSGLYRQNTEEILLFFDGLVGQSYYKVFEIISHEIVHAVQHYKKTSEEYNRAVDQDLSKDELAKKAYYTDPVEFEATLSGILSQLLATYNDYINHKKKYKKQHDYRLSSFFERKMWGFLKSLELFAKSTPETYFMFNELEIPAPLKDREEFFRIVSELPYYKRKYQKAFLAFVQNIQKLANTY